MKTQPSKMSAGDRIRVLHHLAAVSWRVDRFVAGAIVVLSLGLVFAAAGIALAQRWVVDGLRHPGSGRGVLLTAILVGASSQVVWVMGTRLRNTFRSGMVSKMDVELAEEVAADVADVPGLEHFERGEYLDRVYLAVRGTYSLAGYGFQLLEAATAAASLAMSVFILMSVQPWLLLLVAVASVTLWAGDQAQRAVRRANEDTAAASRLELHLHKLCLNSADAKEIRIAGSGPELDRRARALWAEVTRNYAAARIRGAAVNLAGWGCYAVGLAVALALTARQVLSGATAIGSLVLVVSLTSQLRGQLSTLQQGWSRAAEAGEASSHYLWIKRYSADSQRQGEAAPTALAEGIALEDVSFSYAGGEPVLKSISARIAPGTIVGLVGINGAGKTTMIKLLTGLLQPTGGRITVEGLPLPALDARSWASACRGVFQDFTKFEFLLRETVGIGDLPNIGDSHAVSTAISEASADAIVADLPEGIDTQLGAEFGGAQLSHGQWQRIALARGLMRQRPLLLVLDEPTAALDPQAEHDLFENFARQARKAAARTGAVTLLVSHRFSTVDMADQIIVISDGVIVESGSHAELMATKGRYAHLYATQAAAYAASASTVETE